MTENKTFDCPSCFEPVVFGGGNSVFETCRSCNAPVIVPSEFLYEKRLVLESADFASLMNDKPVDVDQVTNELTPGDSLPDSTIEENPYALIEQFDVYQEKIGTGSIAEKQAFDQVAAGEGSILDISPLAAAPKRENSAIMDSIQTELSLGRKVTAIKIFREGFGTSLQAAKAAVEAIERGETIDLTDLDSFGE